MALYRGNNGMVLGPGPYQRQDTKSEIKQPLLHAAILCVLVFCVWLPALYMVAVLADWLFSPLMCGVGLAMLLRVGVSVSGITFNLRQGDIGKRIAGGLLFVIGLFVLYLRMSEAWGWTLAMGDGRLWIGTPWGGLSIPAAWQVLRYALVVGLPLVLIPTGISLCRRFIMEIEAPSLANSIRALSGRLTGQRWLEYPNEPQAEAEDEGPPPPPTFM